MEDFVEESVFFIWVFTCFSGSIKCFLFFLFLLINFEKFECIVSLMLILRRR